MSGRRIQFTDFHPRHADFFAEVVAGLQSRPKTIAPKFFYDQRGSELFERICRLPEYYLTRTEMAILTDNAREIGACTGRNSVVFEPGSGNCEKIRPLLNALQPQVYIPCDISKEHLLAAAQSLAVDFPWLRIHAACADFTGDFALPEIGAAGRRKVAFFPGSSIGNFEPRQAVKFMARLADFLAPEGALIIGTDRKKSADLLNAAYNDAQGVTAAFNKNLLQRINRELGADFDLDRFRHHAFYNRALGRVEMHLVSRVDHAVTVAQRKIHFPEGDSIHTENSYKYHLDEFYRLAEEAGFEPVRTWSDEAGLFSVHLLEVSGSY